MISKSARFVKLQSVAKIVGGGTPATDDPDMWGGDILWVTPPDITSPRCTHINSTRRTITEKGLKSSSTILLPTNAVLMTTRATIGECSIALKPLTTNQGITSFICDESKLDPDFLFYQLSEKTHQLRRLASGSTFLELSRSEIRQFDIMLPEITEQKRIGSFLKSCDAVNSHSLGIIEQINQTKAALMQSLLLPNKNTRNKFKVQALGELFAERKESGIAGLPTLSVTMHDGMVDREEHGRRVASELKPEEHLLAHRHDIAYNMMRMWQGVSGLAPFKGLVSPAYVVLKPLAGIDPLFGSYLFKLPETIRLFHRYSQGLTNDRLRLYYDQFSEIRVPIPTDINEQRRIAKLLETLDQQIEESESLITALRKTKSAICQKLFT